MLSSPVCCQTRLAMAHQLTRPSAQARRGVGPALPYSIEISTHQTGKRRGVGLAMITGMGTAVGTAIIHRHVLGKISSGTL